MTIYVNGVSTDITIEGTQTLKNKTIDNTNTINNITPSTDFTITQNAVSAMTVVAAAAVVDTLYLKAGNVGIGTTNPQSRLWVQGANAKAGAAETVTFIGSSDAVASNPLGITIGHGGSSGYAYIQGTAYGSATANLALQKDGGNVGIGTTSPLELLSLGTAGTTAGVLSLAGATSGKAIINVSAAAGTPTLTLPTTTGTIAEVEDITTHAATNTAVHSNTRDYIATDTPSTLDTESGWWTLSATGVAGTFRIKNEHGTLSGYYVKYENGTRTAAALAAGATHTFTALSGGDDLRCIFSVGGRTVSFEIIRDNATASGASAYILVKHAYAP